MTEIYVVNLPQEATVAIPLIFGTAGTFGDDVKKVGQTTGQLWPK